MCGVCDGGGGHCNCDCVGDCAVVGLLTDIVKDALQHVSPFRTPQSSLGLGPGLGPGPGASGDDDSVLGSAPLLPPPLLPQPGTQSDTSQAPATSIHSAETAVDSGSQEHWQELRAVQYSEQLDDYLAAFVSQCTVRDSGKSSRSLPLRVLLELFVLPALQVVHSCSSSRQHTATATAAATNTPAVVGGRGGLDEAQEQNEGHMLSEVRTVTYSLSHSVTHAIHMVTGSFLFACVRGIRCCDQSAYFHHSFLSIDGWID